MDLPGFCRPSVEVARRPPAAGIIHHHKESAMITPGAQVELRVRRPAVYLSPVGARAEVVDVKPGESDPEMLIVKLRWLFAARGECDGWYVADDFAEVTPIALPLAA